MKKWWELLILLALIGVLIYMLKPGNTAVISKLADAIQFAEGFYSPGSRPKRNNNPGDLETDITGTGAGFDGPYVVYASYADGRAALEQMISGWFNGSSKIYDPSMTIAEVAARYSPDGSGNWANNVASYLNVPVSATLAEIV